MNGVGATAWRPDLPQLTLHLGVQFAWSNQLGRDGWWGLRDARALAEAMSAVDWEALMLLAGTAARAGSCLYWTLRLARTLAGLQHADRRAASEEVAEPSAGIDAQPCSDDAVSSEE